MIRTLVRRTALADRHRELARRITLYDGEWRPQDIAAYQVDRFNEMWARCLAEVPFYQHWQRRHRLPEQISRASDLDGFPPLAKSTLIGDEDLVFAGSGIIGSYTTGGSSGQPARYPRGPGEIEHNWVGAYLGRHWSGIAPLSPTVHLWGHAHLFGSGWRGRTAQVRRALTDRVASVTRLDAYDLSEAAMIRYREVVRRRNPVVISGYTSALFRLARHIEQDPLESGRQSRLRGVVLCAETASDADVALIEEVFESPAIIEYGAAETGVVAMSCAATRRIRVLWDSFICRVGDDGELRITTLGPRVFPLVNYAIGDYAEPEVAHEGTALVLRAILGRKQDVVRVATAGGAQELSAILPVHILKSYPGIMGVQFEQLRPDVLVIYVESLVGADAGDIHSYFVRELRRDQPGLVPSSVVVELVSCQSRTIAGKHPLFRVRGGAVDSSEHREVRPR